MPPAQGLLMPKASCKASTASTLLLLFFSHPSQPTRSPRIRTRLLPPSHSTALKRRAPHPLCPRPGRPRLNSMCTFTVTTTPVLTHLVFIVALLVLIFVLGWKTAASNRHSSAASTLILLLLMSPTFLSISISSSRRRRRRRRRPFARCRNNRKLNRRRPHLDSLKTKPISHKFGLQTALMSTLSPMSSTSPLVQHPHCLSNVERSHMGKLFI